METLRDLVEEAKRRTILMAILVLSVAYIMSCRISVEASVQSWSFTTPAAPESHKLTDYDPLLSGLPYQVAATRWRRIFDSPVVEGAVDQLTKSVIDEFITSLWYSSITPDQEVPEELRILLNGVIAEVANRVKQVNLVTLLSKNVVDLVGRHFDLFRQMKAKIGPDLMESMSTEERDENLKRVIIASRVLHPAVFSPDAEYKVRYIDCLFKYWQRYISANVSHLDNYNIYHSMIRMDNADRLLDTQLTSNSNAPEI